MPHMRIDRGHRTRLPLCDCGWRGHTTCSTRSAYAQLVAHELDHHPESKRARNAAGNYRMRHAANSENVGTPRRSFVPCTTTRSSAPPPRSA